MPFWLMDMTFNFLIELFQSSFFFTKIQTPFFFRRVLSLKYFLQSVSIFLIYRYKTVSTFFSLKTSYCFFYRTTVVFLRKILCYKNSQKMIFSWKSTQTQFASYLLNREKIYLTILRTKKRTVITVHNNINMYPIVNLPSSRLLSTTSTIALLFFYRTQTSRS